MLRHYKVALLLITPGDIKNMEQEISPAKVKPDMSIKNFDLKVSFKEIQSIDHEISSAKVKPDRPTQNFD